MTQIVAYQSQVRDYMGGVFLHEMLLNEGLIRVPPRLSVEDVTSAVTPQVEVFFPPRLFFVGLELLNMWTMAAGAIVTQMAWVHGLMV